jgi:hypothetical protein
VAFPAEMMIKYDNSQQTWQLHVLRNNQPGILSGIKLLKAK